MGQANGRPRFRSFCPFHRYGGKSLHHRRESRKSGISEAHGFQDSIAGKWSANRKLAHYFRVPPDLAGIDWIIPHAEFHEYLRRLLQHGDGCKLAKRLMFGSDQVVWPEAIGMAIAGIESADFVTEEQKRDIFCRNAARFLRLEPAICEQRPNEKR